MKGAIVFTKQERRALAQTLEFEWIRRNVGLASDSEVNDKDYLASGIKKLMLLIEVAKKKGLINFEH